MRITLSQTNSTIGAFEANTSRITRVVETHAETDVFIFPELALSGYMLYDYAEYKSIINAQNKYVERIAHSLTQSQCAIVGGMNTELQKTQLQSNCVFIVTTDKVEAIHAKCALPTDDVFCEPRYFQTGTGPTVYRIQGMNMAFFICYDLWHKEHVLDIAKEPLDCIVWISASPYTKQKHAQRLFLSHQAVNATDVPLFMANAVGANDEIVFDGQSFVMSKDGTLIYNCSLCEEDAQNFELTTEGEVRHLGGVKVHGSDKYVNKSPVPRHSPYAEKTALQKLSKNKAREILLILECGLKDYLRKTRMPIRVHLGLSGGIDSALTAAIAVRALGPEAITAILLPSQYTSKQSIEDAKHLATLLKIQTHTLHIESIFQSAHLEFCTIVKENAFDLTEENMQARIRGMLLMAYANKRESMLLTTGNKSEIAVGYCTLYGDMCGALNLIGDVYKTEVYALAEVLNEDSGTMIINESIMCKGPTAELRENQKDSDSLPEYPVLDAILHEFIENKRTPEWVCEDTRFDPETVHRVWHLLTTAEYKRYQAAPIIKISECAFGRGRIMPIAAQLSSSTAHT